MVVQPCGSASVSIYSDRKKDKFYFSISLHIDCDILLGTSDLYTFQESSQVKNLKKIIGKTNHNRIYLKQYKLL